MAPKRLSRIRPASLLHKLRQLSDRRRRNTRVQPPDPQPNFKITHYPDRPRRPAELVPPEQELIDWFVNIHLQANKAVMTKRSRQVPPVGRYDLYAPHTYQPSAPGAEEGYGHIQQEPSRSWLTPNQPGGAPSEQISLSSPHPQECTAPNTAFVKQPSRPRGQLQPDHPNTSPTFPSFTPSPESCYSPDDKSDVADVLRLYRFGAAKRGSCLGCRTHRHATMTPGMFYCTRCRRDFNCYPPQDVPRDPPLIPPKPLAERRILRPEEGAMRSRGGDSRQKPQSSPLPYPGHGKKVAFVDPTSRHLVNPEPGGDTEAAGDDPFSHLRSEIDTVIHKINPITTIRSPGGQRQDGPVSAVRAVDELRGVQHGKEIVDMGDFRRPVRYRNKDEVTGEKDRDSGLGEEIARCDVRVVKDGCNVRSNSWELEFLEQYELEMGNDRGWK
ncbi:hypothetical protein DL546_003725 [Coniochaeta pulveracea]|uniref:Uncharacterized protein n=1 Tax=Coniochaeta pulveracea TaxID=177199 RepID=A0A420Y3I5_9PEZI|nr:hypothetical protein DL546_003725 [Coniochaeta pulveracea]